MRFGTPAVTSRGLGKEEMKTLAGWIVKVLTNMGDQNIKKQINEEVKHFCERFPVPGIDF